MAGRVVFLGAEDEADEFPRRLVDIVYAHDRNLSDLSDFRLLPMADADALLPVPAKKRRDGTDSASVKFAAGVREFRPILIVLDTAADLDGGDEIKRSQVRQFVSLLRKMAMEIACAIVLLAHPSVSGMQSGFIGSFNGRLRDEQLNETLFTRWPKRVASALWCADYNTAPRPHSHIAWQTPDEVASAFKGWTATPRGVSAT